ncbi:hypothetical protein ACTFIV_008668 [Dictyostelium citrinum]
MNSISDEDSQMKTVPSELSEEDEATEEQNVEEPGQSNVDEPNQQPPLQKQKLCRTDIPLFPDIGFPLPTPILESLNHHKSSSSSPPIQSQLNQVIIFTLILLS